MEIDFFPILLGPRCKQGDSKQLYFFSGFNSGPVYHLRVVERFAQHNLCFVFKLIKLSNTGKVDK
jgi:hypothetical protein